jgi:hypothetical protein
LASTPGPVGGIRLSYGADYPTFAYLLWQEESGKFHLLFSGHLEPGQKYWYPPGEQGLKISSGAGQATAYLLAAGKPLMDLEKEISELKQGGLPQLQELFPDSTIRSLTIQIP